MLKLRPKFQKKQKEKRAKAMRSKVFEHMLNTRGLKYRTFLWHLRSFKYLAFAPTRGEFLESYYVLMRYLDDVVDGDAPLPADHHCEAEYLLEKIAFAQNPIGARDEVDDLMLYCFELADRFGEDFQSETNDILNCLLFDARRKGKGIIYSQSKIANHFYLLDIRGTIRATLKVFNDDPEKFQILEPLGTACRHQFNIDDIAADLEVGYVNIAQEECDLFDISREELRTRSYKLDKWLQHHAREGMALLAEHHKKLPQGDFSTFQKIVFKYVYELPARRTFEKVLSGTSNGLIRSDVK